MTIEDINLAIHKACGHTVQRWHGTGEIIPPLPNYYGDWNTRLELLKELRPHEKIKLISTLWWHRGPAVSVNDDAAQRAASELLILEMPQCEFCEMWLRTKGEWIESATPKPCQKSQ